MELEFNRQYQLGPDIYEWADKMNFGEWISDGAGYSWSERDFQFLASRGLVTLYELRVGEKPC